MFPLRKETCSQLSVAQWPCILSDGVKPVLREHLCPAVHLLCNTQAKPDTDAPYRNGGSSLSASKQFPSSGFQQQLLPSTHIIRSVGFSVTHPPLSWNLKIRDVLVPGVTSWSCGAWPSAHHPLPSTSILCVELIPYISA